MITAFLHVAAVVIMFSLREFDYEVLPGEIGDVYMDVQSNRDYKRALAWEFRNDDHDIIRVCRSCA